MSTNQLQNEAATTQDDANKVALIESFDAGKWARTPDEAQDIARYRASAAEALLKPSV